VHSSGRVAASSASAIKLYDKRALSNPPLILHIVFSDQVQSVPGDVLEIPGN
jgi:hypothetical protein